MGRDALMEALEEAYKLGRDHQWDSVSYPSEKVSDALLEIKEKYFI